MGGVVELIRQVESSMYDICSLARITQMMNIMINTSSMNINELKTFIK